MAVRSTSEARSRGVSSVVSVLRSGAVVSTPSTVGSGGGDRIVLAQCFRGLAQLARPFYDTPFELLIEPVELGLGSLERGGFENVPTPVSPCEDKLVCTHHIQDFMSSARRKRVRAQQGKALIADNLVETIFIVAKVSPVLLC